MISLYRRVEDLRGDQGSGSPRIATRGQQQGLYASSKDSQRSLLANVSIDSELSESMGSEGLSLSQLEDPSPPKRQGKHSLHVYAFVVT